METASKTWEGREEGGRKKGREESEREKGREKKEGKGEQVGKLLCSLEIRGTGEGGFYQPIA